MRDWSSRFLINVYRMNEGDFIEERDRHTIMTLCEGTTDRVHVEYKYTIKE